MDGAADEVVRRSGPKFGLFDAALHKDPIFLIGAALCALGGYSLGASYVASGVDPGDDIVATVIDTVVRTATSLGLFAFLPALLRRRVRRKRLDPRNFDREFTSDAWVILLGLMLGFAGLLFGYNLSDQQAAPAQIPRASSTAPSPATNDASERDFSPNEGLGLNDDDLEFFKDVLSVNYGREVTDDEALEVMALTEDLLPNQDAICSEVRRRYSITKVRETLLAAAGSGAASDPQRDLAEVDADRIASYARSVVIDKFISDMNEPFESAGEKPLSEVSQFVLTNLVDLCLLDR